MHADCEEQLKCWYKEVEEAKWGGPVDVKRDYPAASILPGNRVVFNIKGNTCRLVVCVNYDYAVVWIRFVWTLAAYDKINASQI